MNQIKYASTSSISLCMGWWREILMILRSGAIDYLTVYQLEVHRGRVFTTWTLCVSSPIIWLICLGASPVFAPLCGCVNTPSSSSCVCCVCRLVAHDSACLLSRLGGWGTVCKILPENNHGYTFQSSNCWLIYSAANWNTAHMWHVNIIMCNSTIFNIAIASYKVTPHQGTHHHDVMQALWLCIGRMFCDFYICIVNYSTHMCFAANSCYDHVVLVRCALAQ